MLECPFAQKNTVRKEGQIQAACGQPDCAYTKFRLGIVDKEVIKQAPLIPPQNTGRILIILCLLTILIIGNKTGYCGRVDCKSPVIGPTLPPIHWDCPEPLPKGPCKNPDCPFLPADLRALQALIKKGPCDSPSCTHILDTSPPNNDYQFDLLDCDTPKPVCDNPDCPFQNPCIRDSFSDKLESDIYKGLV